MILKTKLIRMIQERKGRQINMNTHRLKHDALYFWWLIIGSTKKWEQKTLKPLLITW